MTHSKTVVAFFLLAAGVAAQAPAGEGLQTRERRAQADVTLPAGTRIPLILINSISSKHARAGDKVYLESVYPVVVDGRILVPVGAYVSGSVTNVKRTGRVKGRGELHLRFEQIILPNGVIRSLVGRVGALDGRSPEDFDREEGTIGAAGDKTGDAGDVAQTAAAGASVGAIAGAASGNAVRGLGIGAAAGAAAGVARVLLTRGPEAVLERGAQLDMTLDRDLYFTRAGSHVRESPGETAHKLRRRPRPDAQSAPRRFGGEAVWGEAAWGASCSRRIVNSGRRRPVRGRRPRVARRILRRRRGGGRR